MASFADKLVFPAPSASYGKDSYKKHLCWIPWNEAVSPDRVDDDKYADGIPCMWLPAPRAAGVILFCHGNAEDLGMSFAFIRHMRDQFKMNVLAVEYPGYGLLSHVLSSEAACKEVCLTAFRFVLDELKVAYEQIILFGRSIGSGPAIWLASRFPVGGLILVAAFASINQVIRSLVGGLISKVFLERFPNIQLIGNVSCPTLFIHGEKDSLVPPSQSIALFKQCRARKLLITPPSMEHNTNLFTDASYLAVPAINFFGLPGYQQERPPQMASRFFEDGRQQFWLRKFARRREGKHGANESSSQSDSSSNPWFPFCGCPTHKVYAATGDRNMDDSPNVGDPKEYEWEPENGPEALLEARIVKEDLVGAPSTAARETAAAAAAKAKASARGTNGLELGQNPDVTWGGKN